MRAFWRDVWTYVRTLRARWRARKLGVAFVRCPVCRTPFSVMDVWATPGGAVVWMDNPGGGRLVCSRHACRLHAVLRNRRVYGRDLHDPYPPGVRLPTIEGEMPPL